MLKALNLYHNTCTYLPEPLDLLGVACVMSVDCVLLPIINVDLLHTTQHQLWTETGDNFKTQQTSQCNKYFTINSQSKTKSPALGRTNFVHLKIGVKTSDWGGGGGGDILRNEARNSWLYSVSNTKLRCRN